MRPPRAEPIANDAAPRKDARTPRAFARDRAEETADVFESAAGADPLADSAVTPEPATHNKWLWRIVWGAGSLLVSLGLGLLAERLIRDLFARYEMLGWIGMGALALFVAGALILLLREIAGLFRLASLDRLRTEARRIAAEGTPEEARVITQSLLGLYRARPDLARGREAFAHESTDMLDAAPILGLAERHLVTPLDRRARTLVAGSARRVALVTAVSPRALVDIAFVVFESFRLARMIADLYGARPGLLGFFRLVRSILAHLAVTGGLALTDGVVEQLVGQSMASRISSRLGEGLVNGLMTVRVGIAAITVVRPLPPLEGSPPKVADFVPELVRVTRDAQQKGQRD